MRRRALVTVGFGAAMGVAALAAVAPIALGAPPTTPVRVADAFSFGAGAQVDHTVCLDGVSLVSLSAGTTSAPFDVEVGDHHVQLFDGTGADCATAQYPEVDTTVTVPDVDQATLFLYWTRDEQSATVLADDLSCPQNGNGRLVVRYGAAFPTDQSDPPIDVVGTPTGGSETTLVSNVLAGNQGAAELAPGTYMDVSENYHDSGFPIQDDSDLTLAANTVTFRTLYGGADGGVGSWDVTVPLRCQQPTTTTLPTTTTSSTTTTSTTTTSTTSTPTTTVAPTTTTTSTTTTTVAPTTTTTSTTTTTVAPTTTTSTTTTTVAPTTTTSTTTSTTTTTVAPTTTTSTTVPPPTSTAPSTSTSIAPTTTVPPTTVVVTDARAAVPVPALPTYTG